MEYPFSPKEKGKAEMDGFGRSMDVVGRGSIYEEDPFNSFSEKITGFDSSMAWCNSPSETDQMLASYGVSPSHSQPLPCASFDPFTFSEQHVSSFRHYGDASSTVELEPPHNQQSKVVHRQNSANSTVVPRPMSLSIDEKMLRALSLLKETSGGGILAQVWVPMLREDQFFLTTSEQPYLLDQMLAGYREVSRAFTFSAQMKPGFPLGLPGRVFLSKVPEWTSNVRYYRDREYLRGKHAVDHEVRGSIALPIFDPLENSCCAVLELVTVKEKPDFDAERENVCKALQAVNLRSTTPPRLLPQCLSKNQRAALAEISDVLRAVCHAHRLPLALTWIPCNYTGALEDVIKVHVRDGNSTSPSGKCILCIESTACYVNDKAMEGFVRTCTEHYIEEGQGIAGKALQSNHPFFFPDVKTYDISEYPLVHHARKYGLQAAVAIRLRSTYTGFDDYILEFFLPVNITGSSEQQLLLNNLSGTMRRICKSLRTVSAAALTVQEDSTVPLQKDVARPCFEHTPISRKSSQVLCPEGSGNLVDKRPVNLLELKTDGMKTDAVHEQGTGGPRKHLEKKRSSAEKNVSLSVLQQYFSGSLKDAAKSIGVCPTTLKRICRQHGISRWPSRKINKVNRSLRKIQNVLDSVQGVEGGLKFDPATGGFVAAGSNFVQDSDPKHGFVFAKEDQSVRNPANFMIKVEDDEYFMGAHSQSQEKSGIHVLDHGEDSRGIASVLGLGQQTDVGSPLWAHLDDASALPFSGQDQGAADKDGIGSKFVNVDYQLPSRSSSSFAAGDEIDTKMEGEDGVVDHNHPTCSSMTDSSNGSGSMLHGSSSSSQSIEGRHSKAKTCYSGPHITVKATYKEDVIRFKFEPSSAGCFHLYEEVAKRFKLQIGTFQLKYLDDEDEWVMLLSDSDLQECVEILEFGGKHSVKFLVRDAPFSMGSSGGSNCCLAGAS